VELLAVDLIEAYGSRDRLQRLERSRAGLVDRRLRRAIEFMHDNYGRDLSLAEIAAAAYVSEYHFARLFRRLTGESAHSYLAMIRVDQARRLLANSDLSIADVGRRVGYPAPSHFSRVFRAATGMSPSAFREAAVR
jgi:AraC family transcriptional regulator